MKEHPDDRAGNDACKKAAPSREKIHRSDLVSNIHDRMVAVVRELC
jgi:hypothetical protein